MQTTSAMYFRSKEFAARAGVTVRTLHLYDELGLLSPAYRESNGYRMYGRAELERVEQITALRFVGFTLAEIKGLLQSRQLPLDAALAMQRSIIAERCTQLQDALAAIDRATSLLADCDDASHWRILQTVIEAMKMEKNDWEWTKKYYSPETNAKIAERARHISPEELQAGQEAWAKLIAQVEDAAKTEDPRSGRAQELAARWKALVREFTQGDPEIHSGLNKLYADEKGWPSNFKRPWSDEADRFIRDAMNCSS